MPVLTLTDVKNYLGLTGTEEDTFLTATIDRVESAARTYIQRTLITTSYTEYHSGNGQRVLLLRNTPVQSVTEVAIDASGHFGQGPSSFGPETVLTPGSDYALEIEGCHLAPQYGWKGALHRINDVWPAGTRMAGLVAVKAPLPGNIRVTYVAGWQTVPEDLRLALLQMIAEVRNYRGSGGPVQSESLDYYSRTILSPESAAKVFGSIRSLLAPYRRVVLSC